MLEGRPQHPPDIPHLSEPDWKREPMQLSASPYAGVATLVVQTSVLIIERAN